ncbi:heavy metal translocating P-type ATPase [Chryseobacterium taklimakanense]|uniref:heavy metal translocating P-type ATPase n=1 Tax=Chryseobacterium TaxID=59732 RepID=UPI000EFAF6E0|nr:MULTISPECIES: heavy metal translocating P-type ATPase [Chryseobacterium]AYO56858.1 copper-translocating P-type ATPase [Chryseobacterium sp. 6424]MCG7279793.1 heavy metal translocating P-type ATPase [Chryseobacterium taklimakanense]
MKKYTCPMHPQVLKDEPGKCPLCGMDLVPMGGGSQSAGHSHKMNHADAHGGHAAEHNTHNADSYNKHEGHHTHDFLKRFWVSLVVTIPILALSHMIQQWAGFSLTFPGDKYVLLALGTFIYIYGGMPFLKGMVGEIKASAIGMMTLVALAITVAYVYSVAVVFGLPGMDFFWELATLIVIMLLGHWLEMRSQMAASKALQSLVALLPNDVTVERHGQATKIPIADLQNNDTVIIKPGEKIPADGLVIEGSSSVNESMLTGESVPVKKEVDTKVIAGSINGDGALRIKATGVGKDSYLNKVINLVSDAQAAKSNTQNLADKVAKWLTFIAIAVGIGTFAYWYFTGGNLSFALERMVTVMVTACPHALGVAIPLVVAISTTLSATNGLLIRNRTAFETTRKLSTIIFDKTGTLTEGSHAVQKIIPTSSFSTDEIIQYAAAVQQNSEHHIAKGVLKTLKEKNLPLWKSENFKYMQGIGVSGTVNGKNIIAAGPNYFTQNNLPIPAIPTEINQDAETVNFVLIDNQLAGIITLADTIREGAQEAINQLKEMGIKSFLLTGDNDKIAAAVSNQLGMDGYLANVLPHNKQEKVKEFQAKGEIVAMTGDGVNDAPALAQADVGIAVGSGTDVAAETADIILVNSDPRDVVKMIDFGKRTYSKMVQNLIWAVGYNVVAIPLAAGILYPKFVLSPAMGAVLMSVSTIVVAINASLLRLNKK